MCPARCCCSSVHTSPPDTTLGRTCGIHWTAAAAASTKS
jgi:hypothetical protein